MMMMMASNDDDDDDDYDDDDGDDDGDHDDCILRFAFTPCAKESSHPCQAFTVTNGGTCT